MIQILHDIQKMNKIFLLFVENIQLL